MTAHDDFDRALAGWFEADAQAPAPAGGLYRLLDATRRRGPRPAWLAGAGSRWVGETPHVGSGFGARLRLRWSTALLLLLAIAALVGGAVLVGARLLQPDVPLPIVAPGHLAYSLDGEIYVADWDGSHPVQITQPPPGDVAACEWTDYGNPVWSPDGRYLNYRYHSAGCPSDSPAVFISDPNGQVLASFPGWADAVSWSPDSTRVASWVEYDRTIGVYGLDGMRQALLTLPPGFGTHRDEDAHWSPDGESLLISLRPDPGGDPRQTWELPLDGRTPRPLPAEDPRSRWDAAYSADGARVAYTDAWSLLVAARDGSQRRELIREYGITSVAWSPTADRIAFAKDSIPYELSLVDVASGTVTSLASAPGTDSLQVIEFSAGGDRVMYAIADVNYKASLWSVGTDGSDARLLVAGTDRGDWQGLPAAP